MKPTDEEMSEIAPMDSLGRAAGVMSAYCRGSPHSIPELAGQLAGQLAQVNKAEFAGLEQRLLAHIAVLDTIAFSLLRKAAKCPSILAPTLLVGLRAQSQSRETIQALLKLRQYPPQQVSINSLNVK